MMLRTIMLLAIPMFACAGIACLVGIRRFRYLPLAIPATGYFSWVGAFLLFTGIAGPLSFTQFLIGLGLSALGGVCIVGYGLTYNPKMKALGITPRRLLGFNGNSSPPQIPPP
jgi:hypothetical protein